MPYIAHEESKEHFYYSDDGPDDVSLSGAKSHKMTIIK